MKSGKQILSWFFMLLLFCWAMNAQQTPSLTGAATVPRLVNYSAKATDAQGKVISGIAGATFAIYKEESGGSPLWLETQNIQADAKGNYTAQLGATKPDGLPLDLFTSGEARWLGVTVNGGQEQPRVLLLSVPYALKAADAETIGGFPPSAFVLAGKGQGSAPSTKSAQGSAPKNAAPQANPAVTGKGVVDFIPMWDTTSDIVDSIMFQKSSQIGINTTAPAATLDVNGKSDLRDTLTLFPRGTDSTLAVNGTNFKVDQTGKVTFISGQTFPGTGTVTSVGLSASSSDFTVTGSPVTKSGTLKFAWTVPPTNADRANAIVKRDSTGSFSAGTVTVGVVSAGVVSAAASTSGAAINGTSTGTSSGSFGVEGVTSSGTAAGVAGVNEAGVSSGIGVYGNSQTGYGVFGSGGTGVFGTGSNYGFQTDSNVQQARTMGGWVKAMVLYSGPTGNIVSCFNSTLAGAAATTPPCGFLPDKTGTGDYIIDFGFEVDDRFLSVADTGFGLGSNSNISSIQVCTNFIGLCNNSLTVNQVEITSSYLLLSTGLGNTRFYDDKFYLIVY
jgi:hypothetical protein